MRDHLEGFRPSTAAGAVTRWDESVRRPETYHVPGWFTKSDRRRVKFLRDVAEACAQDPDLRPYVVNTVLRPAGASPHDHRAQAAALLAFVQQHVYYTNEDGEQIQTAQRTLAVGSGDCDDSAVTLAAMAMSIGLPVRFCLAGTKRGRRVRWCEGTPFVRGASWSHVYVQLGTPALSPNPTWYSAEPTVPGLPLGHDVVMHGIPAIARHRADLGAGHGMGNPYGRYQLVVGDGPVVEEDTSIWSNVDWSRIMAGVIEGTLTAVAVTVATRTVLNSRK